MKAGAEMLLNKQVHAEDSVFACFWTKIENLVIFVDRSC